MDYEITNAENLIENFRARSSRNTVLPFVDYDEDTNTWTQGEYSCFRSEWAAT